MSPKPVSREFAAPLVRDADKPSTWANERRLLSAIEKTLESAHYKNTGGDAHFFNSAGQFSTTVMDIERGASPPVTTASIRNFWPSAVTS